MLSLDNTVGLRVKIVTNSNEAIIGLIHSYNPHSRIISLISEPAPSNISPQKYTSHTNFKVIKSSFIKSISTLTKEKTQSVNKISLNEKFSNQLNIPAPINPNNLGGVLKAGSKDLVNQQTQFILKKTLHNRKISIEGKEIFTKLFKLFPKGTVGLNKDDSIVIFDNHLLLSKPYKSENCKVIDGTGEKNDQQLAYIKKLVDGIWEELENTRKGG